MKQVTDLAVGVGSVGAIHVLDAATATDPNTLTQGGSLILQILVAIATLFKLFKKKKSVETSE